jgi:hypothetical protein
LLVAPAPPLTYVAGDLVMATVVDSSGIDLTAVPAR